MNMFKQNGIPRKKFNVMELSEVKTSEIRIDIKQHPNGKLQLPKMPKELAFKILEFKGYL